MAQINGADEYFCRESSGTIQYDPKHPDGKKFEPFWAVLKCDQGIVDLYAWICHKYGKPLIKNRLWGAHISFIKGEEPPNLQLWGHDYGVIAYQYTNIIRFDNNCHAWLDVQCERLHEIRAEMGLPPYPYNQKDRRLSLHLTIGRLS